LSIIRVVLSRSVDARQQAAVDDEISARDIGGLVKEECRVG
jgi:hypothetical protein